MNVRTRCASLLLAVVLASCKGQASAEQTSTAPSAGPSAAMADTSARSPAAPASASATVAAEKPAAPPCPDRAALIPSGTLKHAAPDNPVKLVETTVASFCIDKLEVTTAAYETCVSEGKCTAGQFGGFCNSKNPSRSQDPINCVDWNQAETYCRSQGGRLPTEVEWEFAARGSDGRNYPWGNKAPDDNICWRRKKSETEGEGTCPVGSHPRGNSPLGLSDMAGNVREWTSSEFKPGDVRKVQRGGAWDNDDTFGVGVVYREKNSPGIGYYNIGMRCAYDKTGT